VKITPSLLDAFLKCPTKCFLLGRSEIPTGNAYAEWLEAQREANRTRNVERLKERIAASELVGTGCDLKNIKEGRWRLALDVRVETDQLQWRLHAVERNSSASDKPQGVVPMRFVLGNHASSRDKLMLAFDAFAISEAIGETVAVGRIICGESRDSIRIRLSNALGEARKVAGKLTGLLEASIAPELVLNRHCGECQFQARCKQKALEADDLSLFSGMSPEERVRHCRRGIFTIRQLSYTFRPRRRPKKAQPTHQPHHFALQALAIRENTIYVNGSPQIPSAETKVFLDIEGLSSSGPYYALGALVQNSLREELRSFWADDASGELSMITEFVNWIVALPNFRIYHFGSYDTAAIKLARTRLSEEWRAKLDMILHQSTNVLSVVYSHIYFPTYSNGLKDIGRLIGCTWTSQHLSGPGSIMARKAWEVDHNPEIKMALIRYNQEDCLALKRLCEFIDHISLPTQDASSQPGFVHAEHIRGDKSEYQVSFNPKEFADDNLKYVNKCAYFDYQREKVLFRTHPHLKPRAKQRKRTDPRKLHPNKVVLIDSQPCPTCNSKKIERRKLIHYFLLDLKFSGAGVRRFVTKYSSWRCCCLKCRYPFSSGDPPGNPIKFGRSVKCWCVYWNIFRCQSLSTISQGLEEFFGLQVPMAIICRFRHLLAKEYKSLYEDILASMLQGPLAHMDETRVHLRGKAGYVWVVASLDRCYYFWKPNREGEFLQEMLRPFSGVLISDFYSPYDSLPCPQQKCLVHFLRDIDNDLLKNPVDYELKTITNGFGKLLKDVVQTIDRYGLKKRHLHKHKKAVNRFLAPLASRKFSSPLANAYKERFQKSGAKMFTFLDYDGVPWHNNAAEHAIKKFAKYRRQFDSYFTEDTLLDCLILESVLQTCSLNSVNVFRFLLSGEKTLDGLLRMRRRRVMAAPELLCASGDKAGERGGVGGQPGDFGTAAGTLPTPSG
jgi:predicted RecB family nuclease